LILTVIQKTAYLRSDKSLIEGAVKDWTDFVQSAYTAEYQDIAKIYSLINNIDQSDYFPVVKNVDETGLLRVANVAALPAASDVYDGSYAYALSENNFYLCQPDETTNVYKWIFYAHNIGDYSPANADTPIESDISTMPAYISYASQWSAGIGAYLQPIG